MTYAWGQGIVAVCAAFDADPTLTSYEIADRLQLDDSYVRAALRKAGRKLMRGKGQKKANENRAA